MSRFAVRALVTTATAAAFMGVAALPASAVPGSTSADTTVANVSVNSAINLAGLTPDFTLNGADGATVTGQNAVSMSVTTNNLAGYAVTVQAASATMVAQTAGNLDSIPIANLSVREHTTAGAGAYTAMSATSPITVHTQAARSAAIGDAITNDFTVNIPFVNEDTYSATLNYVATTL